MPTKEDLKYFQSMPLEVKIGMTKSRIREWVREYGTDGVYVSFSGGKDSTVLLNIVRSMYPDIEAVFVNTGLEYPEIQQLGMIDDGRYAIPAKAVKIAIDNAPAADVVEVVRCKDCRFAYIDGDRTYCHNINTPWYNDYFEISTNANDFCSYGERKEK